MKTAMTVTFPSFHDGAMSGFPPNQSSKKIRRGRTGAMDDFYLPAAPPAHLTDFALRALSQTRVVGTGMLRHTGICHGALATGEIPRVREGGGPGKSRGGKCTELS